MLEKDLKEGIEITYDQLKKYEDPIIDLIEAYKKYSSALITTRGEPTTRDITILSVIASRISLNPYYQENLDKLEFITESIKPFMKK